MRKNKILAALLALVISLGLWVYAATVVNPDDTISIRNVKVHFVGEDKLREKGFIITTGKTQTVSVEIGGRRSDLKELNSTTLEVVADLSNIDVSNISTSGTTELSWTLDPPSTVASGDIRLISTSSNKITVTVVRYMENQEINVGYEDYGEFPEKDMVIGDVAFSKQTIKLSGPADDVARVDKAVVRVDLEGRTETRTESLDYVLLDEDGNEIENEFFEMEPEKLDVTVGVLICKQVKLEIAISAGGGATADNVDYKIDPPAILVQGSREAISGIDDKCVIQTVDLANYPEKKQSWTQPITIPWEGVSTHVAQANISLTFHDDLASRFFFINCSDFEVLNGNISFSESRVMIKIRGKEDVIKALTVKDIKIRVDMDQYDPTTQSVPLEIILPANCIAGPTKDSATGPYSVKGIKY